MNEHDSNVPQPPEGVGGAGEPGWPDQQVPPASHDFPMQTSGGPLPPGAPASSPVPTDPGYAAYRPGPSPDDGERRSHSGRVWGILLTVLGVLGVIGVVARLATAGTSSRAAAGSVQQAGSVVGMAIVGLVALAALAVGLWLILRSRRA